MAGKFNTRNSSESMTVPKIHGATVKHDSMSFQFEKIIMKAILNEFSNVQSRDFIQRTS